MYFSCNLANTEYLATTIFSFSLNYLSMLLLLLLLGFFFVCSSRTPGRTTTPKKFSSFWPKREPVGRYWSVDCSQEGRENLRLLIYRPSAYQKGEGGLQQKRKPGSSAYIRVVKGDELGVGWIFLTEFSLVGIFFIPTDNSESVSNFISIKLKDLVLGKKKKNQKILGKLSPVPEYLECKLFHPTCVYTFSSSSECPLISFRDENIPHPSRSKRFSLLACEYSSDLNPRHKRVVVVVVLVVVR
jgi:hypothetical protein